MALIQVNWRPDRRELATFGLICSVAFGVVGTWIAYRHSVFGISLAPPAAQLVSRALWALAAACFAGSRLAPQMLRPLYVALTAGTLPIGFVLSHLTMAAVFYGVVTPIALVFRLMGRDALQRRFEPGRSTYWEPRRQAQDKTRYFRQF
jgi:Saxitoxin biosynthesis operon protein SxtJ